MSKESVIKQYLLMKEAVGHARTDEEKEFMVESARTVKNLIIIGSHEYGLEVDRMFEILASTVTLSKAPDLDREELEELANLFNQ